MVGGAGSGGGGGGGRIVSGMSCTDFHFASLPDSVKAVVSGSQLGNMLPRPRGRGARRDNSET